MRQSSGENLKRVMGNIKDGLKQLGTTLVVVFSLCQIAPTLRAQAATVDSASSIVDQLQSNPEMKVTQELLAKVQHLIEAKPTDSTAHLALGTCYDRLSMPDQAAEQFREAIRLAPNDPRCVMQLVRAQLHSGQWQPAMTLLEEGYKRFPKDKDVMYAYGAYLAHMNRKDEAFALFQKGLKENPHTLGLASAIGQLELDHGQYVRAVAWADQDLSIDQSYWPANTIEGQGLYLGGHFDRALRPLSIAYAHNPLQPNICLYYANCCSWAGDYDQALAPCLYYLSATQSFSSKNRSAKEVLEKILRKLPPAYVSERMAVLLPAINRRNPNAAFLFGLGDVLDTVGMHTIACRQYQAGLAMQKSYSMDNDDYRHAFARALLRLGMDLEVDQRNYEEALNCYHSAYKLFPKDRQIAMHWKRLSSRYAAKSNGLAWNLKDWIAEMTQASTKGE